MNTDLSHYDNSWYNPGKGGFIRIVWYFINVLFFINPLNPFSCIKVRLLRLFGAKVGNYTWIGENAWIDNLANVKIGNNVCISQGAMLLCGNHNYKKTTFDLIIGNITLENGTWIGAHSIVCPGVTLHSHSVLGVASVANHDMESYSIYQGNPAKKIRIRTVF